MTWAVHQPLHQHVMDPLEQRPSLVGFEGRNSCIRKNRLGKKFSSSMIHGTIFSLSVWIMADGTVSYPKEVRGMRLLGDNISGKAVYCCAFGTGRLGWSWARWTSEGFS